MSSFQHHQRVRSQLRLNDSLSPPRASHERCLLLQTHNIPLCLLTRVVGRPLRQRFVREAKTHSCTQPAGTRRRRCSMTSPILTGGHASSRLQDDPFCRRQQNQRSVRAAAGMLQWVSLIPAAATLMLAECSMQRIA